MLETYRHILHHYIKTAKISVYVQKLNPFFNRMLFESK